VAAVNGNLGNNPTLGANMAVNSGALYNFLRGGTAGADAASLTTTTGVGNTTDSGLRFVGMMNVGGWHLRHPGHRRRRLPHQHRWPDRGHASTTSSRPQRAPFTNISLESGLQPIEIVYWEQGGNARLRIEVKLSGEADTAYKTLGTDEFALFTPTSAPVLTELQDIVESTTNGTWLVRTGERLDGTDGNDHITGSAGQDVIYGGLGNDTITGGSGASLISGGRGQ
jgi:Ca2+-binding RTX toxin-like protein